MSITGSTHQIATRFASPFGDVGKSLWDRLSARWQQPSYRLPVDARLLRDIGVVGPEDQQFVTAIVDDALSGHGVSAGTILQGIGSSARRRGGGETNS